MFEGGLAREERTGNVTRRVFLFGAAAATVGAVTWRYSGSRRVVVKAAAEHRPVNVAIVEFSAAGARQGVASVPRIIKSDQQWRAQLGRGVYEIARARYGICVQRRVLGFRGEGIVSLRVLRDGAF